MDSSSDASRRSTSASSIDATSSSTSPSTSASNSATSSTPDRSLEPAPREHVDLFDLPDAADPHVLAAAWAAAAATDRIVAALTAERDNQATRPSLIEGLARAIRVAQQVGPGETAC